MAVSYQLRNLTVEEVFAEFRIFCDGYGLVDKQELEKIHLYSTFEDLLELQGGDGDWNDFLPYFGLKLPDTWWAQWKPPLTIRDFCADIASRVQVPISEPVTILGNRCETAGMFLMMKRLLAEAGADASRIAPSAPIRDYARKYPRIFCRVRLAKRGRLPVPIVNDMGLGRFLSFALAITVGVIGCQWLSMSVMNSVYLGFLTLIPAVFIAQKLAHLRNPDAVRFAGIVTFRDFIHAAFDRPAIKPTSAPSAP